MSTGTLKVILVLPVLSIVPVPTSLFPSYTSTTPPSGKLSPVSLSVRLTSIVVLPTVVFNGLMFTTAVRFAIFILDNVSSV